MSPWASLGYTLLALLFYAPVVLGSLLWLLESGGTWALWRRTVGEAPAFDASLGLVAGLLLVGASRAVALSGPGRAMVAEMATFVGDAGAGTWALLAIVSALGEELFFRAVVQPLWGVLPASLLFGLAHVPFERALWPWPLVAAGAGLAFGGLYEATGAVLAPVVAHLVVNALNLPWIASYASTGSATSSPAPRRASRPSGTPRTGSRTDG